MASETVVVDLDAAEPGNYTRNEALGTLLELLADGKPYVFITAVPVERDSGEKGMDLVISTNAPDNATDAVKFVLETALSQLDA